ncbi:MAG TPA: sugar transporter, partial [Gammaproteobacteria bacterium]|nr:sugar transporter [Gammaproteobacteria bacterium]
MNQSITSEGREEKNFSEYLATIIHYRHLVIVTTILLVLVSIVVTYLLPSSYKSEGLILIESQEIPTNLIKSTVTSYASQRIEMIKQRAMTTDKVMEMVEKFDLYPTLRQQAPLSEIVNLFRDNVNIEMLEANVTDPYSGRAKKATIAFTISFLDSQPKTAQYVTNELITEFLDENIKTRTHRAMETTLFLDEEAGKLQRKVRLLEQQIAGFKEKYKESLPELLQFNLSSIERLQEELTANQKQIIQLKDKIAITTLEYTNLKQYIASQERDQYSDSDMEMDLATAEIKLSQLLSKYSTEHPDVKKIKSHITRLKSGDSLNTPLQMKANDP